MPAGTDLVVWNPRVGATGDDRYDPGEVAGRVGPSNAFSDPPTLEEVNAARDFNQVIAEICRRRAHSTTFRGGPSFTAPAYLVPETRLSAAAVNALKTDCDTIRTAEGLGAATWSVYPTAGGKRWNRGHLSELRKALAIDRIRVYQRIDETPQPSLLETASDDSWPPSGAAALNSLGYVWPYHWDDNTKASRRHMPYRLPLGIPAIGVANFRASYKDEVGGDGLWNVRWYRANADLGPVSTGDWGNLDNLELEVQAHALCPVQGDWYDRTDAMAIGAHLAPGAGITWIIVSDYDADGVKPPDHTDERRVVSTSASPYPFYLDLYTA